MASPRRLILAWLCAMAPWGVRAQDSTLLTPAQLELREVLQALDPRQWLPHLITPGSAATLPNPRGLPQKGREGDTAGETTAPTAAPSNSSAPGAPMPSTAPTEATAPSPVSAGPAPESPEAKGPAADASVAPSAHPVVPAPQVAAPTAPRPGTPSDLPTAAAANAASPNPPGQTPATGRQGADGPSATPTPTPAPAPAPAPKPTATTSMAPAMPATPATPAAPAMSGAPTAPSDPASPFTPGPWTPPPVRPAPAASDPLPPLKPDPQRLGYAFDRPAILAQQTLFGVAHGVTLLARACALVPSQSAPSQAAYQAWWAKNGSWAEQAERDLARYYFHDRSPEAARLALVKALQLKTELGFATDSPALAAACATLPQALEKPRYDLERLWLVRRDGERLRRATETREAVAQCRRSAAPADQARLDAALAAWEQDNGPLEAEAVQRLTQALTEAAGPEPKDPATAPTEALTRWQEALRQNQRQRLGESPNPALCAALAAPGQGGLQGSRHALRSAFDVNKEIRQP